MSPPDSRPRRMLATSPFAKPPGPPVVHEVYQVDDRVSHDKYGLGTITRVEETTVVVNFGEETRRITLPSTKLCRL